MLTSGRFSTTLASLADLKGKLIGVARGNVKQLETKLITRLSPYGIGLRRNGPGLLRRVNTFVFFHKSNGDLTRIYEKWVGSPLPELATF